MNEWRRVFSPVGFFWILLSVFALSCAVGWRGWPLRFAGAAGARNQQPLWGAARNVRAADGRRVQLLPEDSLTLVLYVAAECPDSRLSVPLFRDLHARFSDSAVAFRFVVASSSIATRQFSRLLPDSVTVLGDPDHDYASRWMIRSTPSLMLLDKQGRPVRRWSPLRSDGTAAQSIRRAIMAAEAGSAGGPQEV